MDSTQLVDKALLERRVQEMYRAVADDPGGDFHFEMGREMALRLGYAPELLDAIPAARRSSPSPAWGTSSTWRGLREGETVVDLGSGSGTDLPGRGRAGRASRAT